MDKDEPEPPIDVQRVNALLEESSSLMEGLFVTICDSTKTGRQVNEIFLAEIERFLQLRDQLVACTDQQTASSLLYTLYQTLRSRWEVRIKQHDALQFVSLSRRARQETKSPRIDRRVPMPGYSTAAEAAKIIGVSKGSIYSYVERGTLPAYRLGKLWLITEKAVHHYQLTVHRRGTTPSAESERTDEPRQEDDQPPSRPEGN